MPGLRPGRPRAPERPGTPRDACMRRVHVGSAEIPNQFRQAAGVPGGQQAERPSQLFFYHILDANCVVLSRHGFRRTSDSERVGGWAPKCSVLARCATACAAAAAARESAARAARAPPSSQSSASPRLTSVSGNRSVSSHMHLPVCLLTCTARESSPLHTSVMR